MVNDPVMHNDRLKLVRALGSDVVSHTRRQVQCNGEAHMAAIKVHTSDDELQASIYIGKYACLLFLESVFALNRFK
jgi:hypothetical protein